MGPKASGTKENQLCNGLFQLLLCANTKPQALPSRSSTWPELMLGGSTGAMSCRTSSLSSAISTSEGL
eukprot:scaffold1502_cov229-Pinguiococcus_pyrenoidosus.AAC.3